MTERQLLLINGEHRAVCNRQDTSSMKASCPDDPPASILSPPCTPTPATDGAPERRRKHDKGYNISSESIERVLRKMGMEIPM
jgi:hypothetical protein